MRFFHYACSVVLFVALLRSNVPVLYLCPEMIGKFIPMPHPHPNLPGKEGTIIYFYNSASCKITRKHVTINTILCCSYDGVE